MRTRNDKIAQLYEYFNDIKSQIPNDRSCRILRQNKFTEIVLTYDDQSVDNEVIQISTEFAEKHDRCTDLYLNDVLVNMEIELMTGFD
jgi:hypothetical protein